MERGFSFFRDVTGEVRRDAERLNENLKNSSTRWLMDKNDEYLASISAIEIPKETDREALARFFSEDVVYHRLLFCPQVNRDLTDDWGMFGRCPAFILLSHLNYRGMKCLNDGFWLSGGSLKLLEKVPIPILPHFDYFPLAKFHDHIMRRDNGGKESELYRFLSSFSWFHFLPEPK